MEVKEAIEKTRKLGLKVSDNGQMLCPFHDDHNPSAFIYYNQYHKQVEFHCFGCGASMKIETFLERINGSQSKEEKKKISYTPDFIAERLNKNFIAIIDGAGEKEEMELGLKALSYLQSRGFGLEEINTFQIGFCLRRDLEGVLKESWVHDEKRKAFLSFPIKDREGKTFSLQFEDFLNRGVLSNTKLNLSGKRPLAFVSPYKPDIPIFVCEAFYDALSIEKLRDKYTFGTVALLGHPSKEQIEDLKELAKTNQLILALDNDKAGIEMKNQLTKELIIANPYIYGVKLPEDVKDLNECLQKKGTEGLEEVILKLQKETPIGNLQETIPIILERYKTAKENAFTIPRSLKYLEDFLKDGILPGLYAVAGMPGIGKTTWLNILCDDLAKEGIKSFYFLTEEPNYRLILRTVKREGKRGLEDIAILDWIKNRFVLELTTEYRAEKIKELIPSLLETEGKGILIIDSLHALQVENDKLDLREKTIFKLEILSHIARDLLIPVFFTSFIPKSEYINKEQPNLGVFKEAGEIEYLIDVGIVLWAKPDEQRNEEKKEITLTFVKNRFGKTGDKKLYFYTDKCDIKE